MKPSPDYSGKRILFTAFSVTDGSEAVAGYKFIKKHGAKDITTLHWGGGGVAAQIPEEITKVEVAGPDFDPALTEGYDLVFRHQTVRPETVRSPVTTNTIEFFKYCPAPIIGVTGSKGKGTTATLIHKMLEASGVTSHLVGNIGQPALDALADIKPEDWVVFELSSFQLWDLEVSPRIAVLLMIEPEHLDVHSDIDEYVAAKANIAAHQAPKDILVHHPDNQYVTQIISQSSAQKQPFLTDQGAYIRGEEIVIDEHVICSTSEAGLPGPHNLENICAAITAAWNVTQDASAIAKVVKSFKGLEHRLEFVREVDDVKYYDDSIATTPTSAIAALNSFEAPKIMLLGGSDKGQGFEGLAKAIAGANVKHVVLLGEDTARTIETELQKADYKGGLSHVRAMGPAVEAARDAAETGDVVLLSPAAASFDLFTSYAERGQLFKAAVELL